MDKSVNSNPFKSTNDYWLSNLLVGSIMAMFLVLFNALIIFILNLSIFDYLLIIFVSLVMYLVLLFVLFRTNYVRYRKINGKSKNEVIKAIVNEIDGNGKSDKVVSAIKTEFIGSTESRIYHVKSCKLAKLIKRKFKLSDNNPTFFKSKKFKPCKICIKN